jgi:pimeloyl-ACP methyl ester carboxylesterase
MTGIREEFLAFKSSRVHYSLWGNGPELLVCFAGYGESGTAFHFLHGLISPAQYVMLTIDLPFHGRTIWLEGLSCTPGELASIIDSIRKSEQLGTGIFSVMGFSLGGRVALSLVETIPGNIGKMILLAPDGLQSSLWYRMATQTWMGRRWFNRTIGRPAWLLVGLRAANRLGIIHPERFKFIYHYIQDAETRKNLYQRWICLRFFRPRLGDIRQKVKKHQILVRMIFGKEDRMISYQAGFRFCKGIESLSRVEIIPAGHLILQEKHAATLVGLLSTEPTDG